MGIHLSYFIYTRSFEVVFFLFVNRGLIDDKNVNKGLDINSC